MQATDDRVLDTIEEIWELIIENKEAGPDPVVRMLAVAMVESEHRERDRIMAYLEARGVDCADIRRGDHLR